MAYKKKRNHYNLKSGTKKEMSEHNTNEYFSEKITKDHIEENEDYYKYSGDGKEYLVSEQEKDNFCKK